MRNFKSNPVIGVIELALTLFVCIIEPVWPNQDQHDFALCETLFQHPRELGAGAHVNIDKHILATKRLLQILADAKRVRTAVLTSIAYEYLDRHVPSYTSNRAVRS